MITKKYILACLIGFLSVVFQCNSAVLANQKAAFPDIIRSHPRIFISGVNLEALKEKATKDLKDAYKLLTAKMNHAQIPRRLGELRDYIYKYGYLFRLTGDKRWAQYAIKAMDQIPISVKAYGGGNNGYAYAIEGLAIGLDWCHDELNATNKKEHFISLINQYYPGNLENIKRLPDFHNYAAQAEFAMLIAGLATYGENPKASLYISQARDIVEFGTKMFDREYNVKKSVDYVDGTCNWEGVTYGRRQLFAYIKYCEALRTATAGRINPWKNFATLHNAGYYIIYSLRPDNLFENVGDVNYRRLTYFDMNNMAALQSIFKDPYFTTFLNKYYRWEKGKFQTDIWLGHYNASLIFYLMWYDPKIIEANLNDLPLSKRFGDIIIIRTGFDPDDTFITFKSGLHWGFHSQLDHGSFTVFKYSPLVIDSGFYDRWWGPGKNHNWNYWKRTIAHNTLLIYDPDESIVHWPKNFPLVNDGGQRIAFRTFIPPHLFSRSHNRPFSISDLNSRTEEFKMGRIIQYVSQDNYVFINTDLTKAYNNRYAGIGNNQPRKAKLVNREFLYLKPNFIIILDRVTAVKPGFVKKWLLHSGNYYDKSGKPLLNGKSVVVQGTTDAGIVKTLDSDEITVAEGTGKLFIKVLLPKKRIIRRIGGKGYEFWVDGRNQELSRDIPKGRRDENPGAWRIEIQPLTQQKNDIFLNVLYFSRKDDTSKPVIDLLRSSNTSHGVQIKSYQGNWIVLFNKKHAGPMNNIEYEANILKNCNHIIFNVKPNSFFKIERSTKRNKIKITITETDSHTEARSSSLGILLLKTD